MSRHFSKIDAVTGVDMSIDYAHHELHSGSSFTAQVNQLVSDTNDRTTLGLLTPAGTKLLHMFASMSASAAALCLIREGAAVGADTGATHAVINRRRDSATATIALDTSQSPDTAGSITYWNEAAQGSVTEDGTLLWQAVLGGGSGPRASGGENRGEAEFILKPSTQYVFYVKSLTNDDNYHAVLLGWYEHIDVA